MQTDLNQWLAATAVAVPHGDYQRIRQRLVCNDGTLLSVQASQTHYCLPRVNSKDLNAQKYTHLEVWRVSKPVPNTWSEYGDPEDNPYAYIPIELVEEFISSCGGIKE